jgi:hypothetical protein
MHDRECLSTVSSERAVWSDSLIRQGGWCRKVIESLADGRYLLVDTAMAY